LSVFPIGINPVGSMFNAIRSNDNISETEIHTDKGFNIVNVLFGNINGLKQIKFTFFVNQISLALNVRQISRIMANKVYLLPTADTPQGNDIIRLVSHNPTIISNTSERLKTSLSFLINLVSICNFCNCTYQA